MSLHFYLAWKSINTASQSRQPKSHKCKYTNRDSGAIFSQTRFFIGITPQARKFKYDIEQNTCQAENNEQKFSEYGILHLPDFNTGKYAYNNQTHPNNFLDIVLRGRFWLYSNITFPFHFYRCPGLLYPVIKLGFRPALALFFIFDFLPHSEIPGYSYSNSLIFLCIPRIKTK